jgi:shikimate kinase
MAKIIELCGLAGAGKSTIYKEMIGRWNKTANWTPGNFLYPQEKLKFDSLSKLLLSFERKFIISEGNVDERTMKEYGDRFVAKYPEFVDACWNNIFFTKGEMKSGKDLRFDKARYLYSTLQKFQFLRESKTPKAAVLDEGLVHRLANGLYRPDDLAKEVEEVYQLVQIMPLPDVLVYISTDIEEVARRLYQRHKVTISHNSLSLAELENISRLYLERIEIVMKSLEHTNIPVLHIDSKHEVSTNARAIIKFIEETNNVQEVKYQEY